jgi:predicted dehydrogenase
MLDEAELDILDVVTSRGMHFEPALAGIERGLDILCEKPLAHTLDEARTLYRRAEAAGVVTHMGFTFRYSPAVRYMCDLIRDGFIGDVYHVQGFEQNAQLIDPATPLPRIGFSPETDSGALHGYGSHLIDLARWMVGEYEQVVADMETYIGERPVLEEDTMEQVRVDDSSVMLARFENGAHGVMQFTKVAIGNPPGVDLRILGSEAGLWVRLEETPDGYERLWAADVDDPVFRLLDVPDAYQRALGEGAGAPEAYYQLYYAALVDHFLARVRRRETASGAGGFHDGLRTQEVLEAAERSHRERRWVQLEDLHQT